MIETRPIMHLSLCPASSSDYVQIASWIPDYSACRRWAGPLVPYPFLPEDLPKLLDAREGQAFCLVDAADAVLGFGQYLLRPDGNVHLQRIIVNPQYRGAGLGRHLCELLMQQAISRTSAEAITLNVYRDNEVAMALYRRLGFREADMHPSDDVALMIRPLRQGHAAPGTF